MTLNIEQERQDHERMEQETRYQTAGRSCASPYFSSFLFSIGIYCWWIIAWLSNSAIIVVNSHFWFCMCIDRYRFLGKKNLARNFYFSRSYQLGSKALCSVDPSSVSCPKHLNTSHGLICMLRTCSPISQDMHLNKYVATFH